MKDNAELRLSSQKRRAPTVWVKAAVPFQVAALALICTLMLLVCPALSKAADTVTWDLTQGTALVSAKAPQAGGPLTTGLAHQSAAQSRGPASAPDGKFTITYTVQEKGGKYILRGTWDITKEGALKTSHPTPDSVQGLLYTELPFNPATSAGNIDAEVLVVPMLRQGGEAVKAQGSFKGNEKFEGTLSITRTP
ncbi:MAG: hypothetical protein PHU44_06055 [Syntrophales bacterium]|nr:hypothetical protein [Syntrophales bacterium]MDD5641298.1 hypothetical protein [Syntrophales bacterium]